MRAVKKRMICTVASAMVLASMPCVDSFVVSAKTVPMLEVQPEKIEIKTAQDFINAFCSLRKVDEQGKLLEEYILITEVTEKNYEPILKGVPVFESLKEEMKVEIDKALELQWNQAALLDKTNIKKEAKYKTYKDLVEAVTKIDQELFPEKYDPTIQPEDGMIIAPIVPETPLPEENKPTEENKDPSKEENKEPSKEDNKPAEENKKPSKEENKPTEEDKESSKEENKPVEENKDEQKPEENKPEVEEDRLLEEEVPMLPVYPIVKPVEENPENKEETQPALAVLALETPVVEEKIEPVVQENLKVEPQKLEERKMSSKAKAFIDAYLRSSTGQIYASANELNYKNILNGLSSWNKLTSSQKNEVNDTLKKQSGKTYQALLKEAQRLQLSGITTSKPIPQKVPNRVHTATENNAGLYGLLMGASIAVAGLLIKKKKEEKERI